MAKNRLKRPRDTIALAKLIGDIATGQVEDKIDDGKDPKAVERGHLGGIQGGISRREKLTLERRSEIARKAARARWKK